MNEQVVNVPLLRKAVEWAEAEAAKPVELSQWYQASVAIAAEDLGRQTDCGTCFCIAGYVVALHHKVTIGGWGETLVDGDDRASVCALAREYLGLVGVVTDLFAYSNTIEEVRDHAESIAGERL